MHAVRREPGDRAPAELGHRRIAAIAGAEGGTRPRSGCTVSALRSRAPAPPRPGAAALHRLADPGGEQAAEELLTLPDPPTAIFGFNDNVAIGALNAARERGLRVPEDLSIVGFDDTSSRAIVWPQLTTGRQPLAELGRTGVSLLMRLLDGQRVEALRMELSTTLVVRGSTAPPREPRVGVAVVALVVAAGAVVGSQPVVGGNDCYVIHPLIADRPGARPMSTGSS